MLKLSRDVPLLEQPLSQQYEVYLAKKWVPDGDQGPIKDTGKEKTALTRASRA